MPRARRREERPPARARVQAGLLLLVGAVGSGCYHGRMALPVDFVRTAPALRVQAEGSAFSRAQALFGPYRIRQQEGRRAVQPLRFSVEDTRSASALSASCVWLPPGAAAPGLRCTFRAAGQQAPHALLEVPLPRASMPVRGALQVQGARYEVRGNARVVGHAAALASPVGYELWREGRLVGAVQTWSGGPVWLDDTLPPEEGLALAAACAGLLGQGRGQGGRWGQTPILLLGKDEGPPLLHPPGEEPEPMRVSAALQLGAHFLVSASGEPPRRVPLYLGVAGTYWVLDTLGLQLEVGQLHGPGDTLSLAGLHAQLPFTRAFRLSVLFQGGLLRRGGGGVVAVFSPGAGLSLRATDALWLGATLQADQVQELGGRLRAVGSVGWAF